MITIWLSQMNGHFQICTCTSDVLMLPSHEVSTKNAISILALFKQFVYLLYFYTKIAYFRIERS